MTHALVLVESSRDAMNVLGPQLGAIDGVRDCFSVTGEWDFVCVIESAQHDDLRTIVTAGIGALEGVERTQTMVAFERF